MTGAFTNPKLLVQNDPIDGERSDTFLFFFLSFIFFFGLNNLRSELGYSETKVGKTGTRVR